MQPYAARSKTYENDCALGDGSRKTTLTDDPVFLDSLFDLDRDVVPSVLQLLPLLDLFQPPRRSASAAAGLLAGLAFERTTADRPPTPPYAAHYGFSEAPFAVAPNPRFLIATASHSQVVHDVVSALREFLASLEGIRATALVVLDDAHALSVDVLETLAELYVSPSGMRRLLQIVLVGRPSLMTLLKRPELRSFDRAVRLRTELGPLAPGGTEAYLAHRLKVSGGSARAAFGADACARLHEIARGVPRTINMICDRALTLGYERGAAIDGRLIEAAAIDLGFTLTRRDRPWTARMILAAAFVGLMLVGGAGAAWVFRAPLRRAIAQWQQAPTPPAAPVR